MRILFKSRVPHHTSVGVTASNEVFFVQSDWSGQKSSVVENPGYEIWNLMQFCLTVCLHVDNGNKNSFESTIVESNWQYSDVVT